MFDLEKSSLEAEKRLGRLPATRVRRPRSDRGRFRLAPGALELLRSRLAGHDKPAMNELMAELGSSCAEHGFAAPSRATVYKLLDAVDVHNYPLAELPATAREALYNIAPPALVPGRQVAFYCFNYGDLGAACFAAGLPWLDLWQAARMRGWRPKSRGLLEAVCRARHI